MWCLNAQDFVKTYIAPFAAALSIASNPRVHMLVRAGFVQLINRVYVDTDPLDPKRINLGEISSVPSLYLAASQA